MQDNLVGESFKTLPNMEMPSKVKKNSGQKFCAKTFSISISLQNSYCATLKFHEHLYYMILVRYDAKTTEKQTPLIIPLGIVATITVSSLIKYASYDLISVG